MCDSAGADALEFHRDALGGVGRTRLIPVRVSLVDACWRCPEESVLPRPARGSVL